MTKNILTVLTTLSLPLAIFAFSPGPASADDKDRKHHGHEAHAGHMLEGYIAVADALYKDDLDAAKKSAKEMVSHDEDSSLAKPAAKIADAEDLAVAREAFKSMSAEAVKMAKAEESKKYSVMHCPMVKGGGGDWLSADGKVNNPYFGARMPHCGGLKK